jgi:hypothetical protein
MVIQGQLSSHINHQVKLQCGPGGHPEANEKALLRLQKYRASELDMSGFLYSNWSIIEQSAVFLS